MKQPDALVTVQGGVAEVQVFTPGLVIEVRDYDVEGSDNEDGLWTDRNGHRCVRYLATHDGERTTAP